MGPQIENGYLKIANDIYDAFGKTRIRAEYRQMLDFIIRKTYGFNKKSDNISTSQMMEGTGLKRHAVHKARKWLKDRNFITVTQKGHTSLLTYSFQKDYTKWMVSPKRVTVTHKGHRVSPKRVTGCNPKGLPLLLTKDTLTKDNIQKTIEPKTAQAKFLESFSGLYENQTGHPFKSDKKHFVIIANLIKKYGYEATVEKAKLLAVYCQQGEVWFAREGWSCFTPETLSAHWNRIIPILTEDQKKAKKSEEIYQKLKEERRRTDELVKDSIAERSA